MTEGTLLYNSELKSIFPITNANVVISEADGSTTNVENCLIALFGKIAELQGDKEATTNIIVKVLYLKTNIKNIEEIMTQKEWSEIFELPDSENPFVWKKTTFSYKGAKPGSGSTPSVYELVASDVVPRIQNIYTAVNTGEEPSIVYPPMKDENGKPIKNPDGTQKDDLTAFDKKLPEGWSTTPVSIRPEAPLVFMSTRTLIEGKWNKFSKPAQFGRWAFDSELEIMYTVTALEEKEAPEIAILNTNPGKHWKNSINTEFTGKLWMITATSVNNVLNADKDGNIWHGPNLVSIIK